MLSSLEAKVIHRCPSHVAEHWHSATHIAVASLVEQTLEDICNYCVRRVDLQLSLYSSADPEARKMKLYTFLQKCVNFKQRLDRQTSRSKFSYSSAGGNYHPERMESIAGEDTPAATVWFCLWPGLWKDNMLIQSETVWTNVRD